MKDFQKMLQLLSPSSGDHLHIGAPVADRPGYSKLHRRAADKGPEAYSLDDSVKPDLFCQKLCLPAFLLSTGLYLPLRCPFLLFLQPFLWPDLRQLLHPSSFIL